MSQVIKFTNVSDEELEMLVNFVQCLSIGGGVVLVPMDCYYYVREVEDNQWTCGLTGEVVDI